MSKIKSSQKQSNSGWHRSGQPTWWARMGQGDDARFLRIGSVRGDRLLDCEVDVPVGTQVAIGVGAGKDGIREQVVASDDADVVAAIQSGEPRPGLPWVVYHRDEDQRWFCTEEGVRHNFDHYGIDETFEGSGNYGPLIVALEPSLATHGQVLLSRRP